MKNVIALLVAFSLWNTPSATAEENQNQLKSIPVAIFLGLDPIPGDSLLYSGHGGQAAGSLFLGIAGTALAIRGSIEAFVAGICEGDGCPDDDGGEIMLITGLVLYGSSIIWDAVGGIYFTKKHNEEVRSKASRLQRIQPTVGITNNGGYVGAQVRF